MTQTTDQAVKVGRAIISVSDKTGLAEFAHGLAAAGVEIYSTGGTRRFLVEQGLSVRDIADYTGFPEMMDGRVKTLHPKVFGGILWRRDNPEDKHSLAAHGIESFDLVVVNLYPFEQTVARGASDEETIEQIDIGGPSLVRAAAKNHAFVTIATSPDQYSRILAELSAKGGISYGLRRQLAAEAYAHTARYDAGIARWFAATGPEPAEDFPARLDLSVDLKEVLRYGENPHQRAALYAERLSTPNLVGARQLNGKELSYNNLLDLDSALAIVRGLARPAAVVIKHNNPCGAAAAEQLSVAAGRAMAGDPVSAFGSVLGFNRMVDLATAEVLCEPGLFVEAIVAPDFAPDALVALTTRPKWKANVRLLAVGAWGPARPRFEYRQVDGGLLRQEADVLPDPIESWTVATTAAPSDAVRADLEFAWAIVRHVKSNAIVLAKDQTLLGTGAGQMSRVDSVRIAIEKAGPKAAGSVLGSDAFFPFPDSIDLAAAAGVKAVVQPGGSRNDEEVTAACNRHGISMLLTGRRHFKH
ncbi:MAG TPA: bifunctional phosphoribosylaminoimidazolecarboxamide formyltransferase/IMP cyclohydrolase [Pirellulales bacterium]|nr:bifunctional phosphoribosylaminoimidazolecarboxamide formyltransferase/IMP cyclohydrolase [Pirellulales bacterium]